MTIAYSQRDVEWADDRLGDSPDLTMGQAGCLVTSIASVLSDLTDSLTAPGELNQWLKQNRGFTGGGLFVWDSIAPLGLRRAETISCATQPAPIKHLSDVLASGSGVVIEVDALPDGALNQHWVRLLSIDDKDGQIMDPWQLPGNELTALSRYFAVGWTSARAIFMVVVYNSTAPSRDLLGDDSHQPALCPRPEDTGRGLASPAAPSGSRSRRRIRPKALRP